MKEKKSLLAKLWGLFKNARYIYYYVPQCPLCGSWRTGRYFREPHFDPEYTYRKSLSNGELIRFVKEVPDKNCFCEDCGYEWHYLVTSVFVSSEELSRQKQKRGLDKKYMEYKEANYINGRPPKSSLFNRLFL